MPAVPNLKRLKGYTLKSSKTGETKVRKNFRRPIAALLVALSLAVVLTPVIKAEKTFTPPDQPGPDEMMVYFIRESNLYRAARHVWVACNETALASLSSGGYCYFKVKSGPNIINVVQDTIPLGYYLLKFSPGETVFLAFSYSKRTTIRVTQDDGKKLVMKYKNDPLVNNSNGNDGYDIGLMNPGLFCTDLLKPTEEIISPDAENAVITFIRPGNFWKQSLFGLWSPQEYLGTLKGQTYFQVKVKPGKHIFFGKAEHYSVLEAEVEAGKNYYVEFNTRIGWNYAHIQLLPVKRETDDKTLQDWLNSSTRVAYDKSSLTDDLWVVMGKSLVLIGEILQKVEAGEVETRKLLPVDARQLN
jgi:hypothetical protein